MKKIQIILFSAVCALICGSCASHRTYWGVEGNVPGYDAHYYVGQDTGYRGNPHVKGSKAWKKWEKEQRKAAEKRRKQAAKRHHRHDRGKHKGHHRHHD